MVWRVTVSLLVIAVVLIADRPEHSAPDGSVPRLIPGLLAQTPTPTMPAPRYRSAVDLVVLDVCVWNKAGQLVSALNSNDFLVLENEVPQPLALFLAEGQVPLSVVLLLDRSASMAGEKLLRAQAAATAFIRRLRPGDSVSVMTFNESADRRLPLTQDHAAAERAIAGMTADGQTSLFEAIMAGLRDLQKARKHRNSEARDVILVLSDGEDTSSRPKYEDVLEDVRDSGVLLYGVSLRTDGRDRCVAPSRELLQLANDSGGRAVAVGDLSALGPVYEEIATELRHLYRLAYVPINGTRDGSWRSISVRLADRSLVARTRAGYYAPKPKVRSVGP